MAKQTFRIDPEDDIQIVIQKLAAVSADELDLVVPTGARILQNIVDVHLLKELADRYGKKITLITADLMGKMFAQRAGLEVAGLTSWPQENIMATPVMASRAGRGRISDIIPQRSRKELASQGKIISLRNRTSSQGMKFSSFKKNPLINKSSKSDLNKKKGDVGANFLRSYREERSRTSSFQELKRLTNKRIIGPFRWLNTSRAIWIMAVVAILISAFIFIKVLPRAEITVYPVKQEINGQVGILISSQENQADFAKGIIPGEVVVAEQEERGEFTATGLKNVSQKAKGLITIYNEFSSQAQSLIPSRFQSEDGKIFWTIKTIIVPGASVKNGKTTAGQIEAEIVASEPGEEYNIAPTRFNLPAFKNTAKGEKIYARSNAPMAGGEKGETKVVSNEDAEKALNSLKERIKPQFKSFQENLPNGFKFWPEAYNEELADSVVSPAAGEPAEKFNVSIKMVARAIIFKSQDLDNYINSKISEELIQNKILLPSSMETSFVKSPLVDYQKGAITTVLSVKYNIMDQFDSEAFKRLILKKKVKEIQAIILSYQNIEWVGVKLWPFWVRWMQRVPDNLNQVTVLISGL